MTKYVNVDGLNFRIGPGTSYSVITVLKKGQAVEVLQDGTWCKIQCLNKIGYVSSAYLVATNPINLANRQQDIVSFAKTKLGCSYVYGAEGPSSFDCSGFIKYIYNTVTGITMPRVSKEQSKFGDLVKFSELKVCDLIFFDTDLDGVVNHVGMYIGNNTMIHASSSAKKVVITTISDYYTKRFVNARRILK
ncbi:MAG: NlpC/P60 family protein [Peptostreptococcaceae bacterium]